METETIIAAVTGVVVGFLFGKASGREKSRIVWTEPVDFERMDQTVKDLALSGKKIQAIKRYRQIYQVDLKAAKEAVEGFQERQKRRT